MTNMSPEFLTYFAARREHAWRLRREGLTFRAIGPRLGVHASRAVVMIKHHQRSIDRGGEVWLGYKSPAER